LHRAFKRRHGVFRRVTRRPSMRNHPRLSHMGAMVAGKRNQPVRPRDPMGRTTKPSRGAIFHRKRPGMKSGTGTNIARRFSSRGKRVRSANPFLIARTPVAGRTQFATQFDTAELKRISRRCILLQRKYLRERRVSKRDLNFWREDCEVLRVPLGRVERSVFNSSSIATIATRSSWRWQHRRAAA
jgi:hypothetical protein